MVQATAPFLDSTGAIRRVRRYPTKADQASLGRAAPATTQGRF